MAKNSKEIIGYFVINVLENGLIAEEIWYDSKAEAEEELSFLKNLYPEENWKMEERRGKIIWKAN